MGCDEGMDTKEIGNKGCTDQEKREWFRHRSMNRFPHRPTNQFPKGV